MTTELLCTTPLFYGINKAEIENILPCLLAQNRAYQKGDYIYRLGDHVHSIGILISGKISIENDDLWGNRTILNMITPGNVFAETYACIPNEPLMVNVVAIEDSEVLFLDTSECTVQ